MPQTKLKAGVYWIGALFDSDTTCFFAPPPAGETGPGRFWAFLRHSPLSRNAIPKGSPPSDKEQGSEE